MVLHLLYNIVFLIDVKHDLVFVHHSNLSNTSYLKKGEAAEFEVENSQRGRKAVNVVLID